MEAYAKEFNILRQNIKPSYENDMHKKVSQYDIVLAIPNGKKYYMWFSTYEEKNVVFMIEGNNIRVVELNRGVNWKLHMGTVFYGTLFYSDNKSQYSIEDIYYYKGKSLAGSTWLDKFSLLKTILKEDFKEEKVLKEGMIRIGLPIMKNNINELFGLKDYYIYSFHFRNLKYRNSYVTMYKEALMLYNTSGTETGQGQGQPHTSYNNQHKYLGSQSQSSSKKVIYYVKANIDTDIYMLYNASACDEKSFVGIPCIPDYKTSVMMNSLFRDIKENANLDLLEESDDEDEFEDHREDKYVDTKKVLRMYCDFHHRFKKWYPVSVV